MNDAPLYTGIDGEQVGGPFGNEVRSEATEQLVTEQRQQLAELTPKLQAIVDMIDAEIESVGSIKRFKAAASTPEADIRSELQAAALYEDYLSNLKTKFSLALEETKGKR